MRFIRAIIGFLIILALVIFLLSNRGAVDLGYWPFGFVVAVPLGAIVLVALILGVLLGLLLHLPRRLAAQRRARRAEKRAAELENRYAVLPPPASPPAP
ncbi:MAG: hypothetical protein B7Z81_11025 [Acidocella sp. 20-61-6]|nr:MAG: hypothetical protein B7Z81_11025 [Acidocella sp. 20-61-6]